MEYPNLNLEEPSKSVVEDETPIEQTDGSFSNNLLSEVESIDKLIEREKIESAAKLVQAIYGPSTARIFELTRKIEKPKDREERFKTIAYLCEIGDDTFSNLGRKLTSLQSETDSRPYNTPSLPEKTIADYVEGDWFDDISKTPPLKQNIDKCVAFIGFVQSFQREIAAIVAIKLFDGEIPKKQDGDSCTPSDVKDLFAAKIEQQMLRMQESLLNEEQILEEKMKIIHSKQYELVSSELTISEKLEFKIENGAIKVQSEGGSKDKPIDRCIELFDLIKEAGYIINEGVISAPKLVQEIYQCLTSLDMQMQKIKQIKFESSKEEILLNIEAANTKISDAIKKVL